MKIISGKYKGRILKGYNIDGTRPTMDRVKESLFAMIQDYIKDAVVLDLYSGTGNLAIEAISNGAKEAYMVDNNTIAINTIKDNIKLLNIENYNLIKQDALSALQSFISNVSFDIIFLDPPYHTNEIIKSLEAINNNINLINDNGIIVCETESSIDYSCYDNFKIIKSKAYGQKLVTVIQKKIKNID